MGHERISLRTITTKSINDNKIMKLKYRHPDLVCLNAAGLDEF